MITNHTQTIPILYPLMPDELSVKILSEGEDILSINAIIDDTIIVFLKNKDGRFTVANAHQHNKPYFDYIIRQLNRMFGDM